ncbi:MAG: carboxypeptidase-like regulatory domain-containing protein [Bacteroidetes bacterium]|nr:carboxypeptidase-like regulatory domain-containing protein [Bacteroidota bacterium]
MNSLPRIIPFLFFLILINTIQAQETDKDLVQFSGITITADSLNPVPFTKILIRNTKKGTTSDVNGYFSFVAKKHDSIIFTALGFKPERFIIPDTITKNRYSLIQLMTADTITLPAAYIFPWPTLEDFKRAFVNTEIPDDDLTRAKKNLNPDDLRRRMENYPMDGTMNFNNYIETQTSRLYYFGQQQPFAIFNPFAWAKFIKAWKEGKFKRKDNSSNE